MDMKKILHPLIAALLLACGNPSPTTDEGPDPSPSGTPITPDGLLGEWVDVQDSGRTHVHERWQYTKDSTLSGVGCVLTGKDTVFIEHLALLKVRDTLHYAVSVGKGGGQAVLFKLVHDRDSLVFTNPSHDMPQRIVYTPNGPDGWTARVSGAQHGRIAVDVYRFNRVKQEVATP